MYKNIFMFATLLRFVLKKMRLELHYDKIGIISSSLCMIHCLGTPFIFVAKACSATCCSDAPTWWLNDRLPIFNHFIYSYLLYNQKTH